MLTNVPPILVRMEPSVQTLTETTSVLVTTDLLARTVIKVRKIILVSKISRRYVHVCTV